MSQPQQDTSIIEALQAAYNAAKSTWVQSPCRRYLIDNLESRKPIDGWKLEGAVTMALGRLDGENGRSMHKLALFTDVVQHLSADSIHPITMYAEESTLIPFGPTEMALLRELNIALLTHQEVEYILSRDYFFFAMHYGLEGNLLSKPFQFRPKIAICFYMEHLKGFLHALLGSSAVCKPCTIRRAEANLDEFGHDHDVLDFCVQQEPCVHAGLSCRYIRIFIEKPNVTTLRSGQNPRVESPPSMKITKEPCCCAELQAQAA